MTHAKLYKQAIGPGSILCGFALLATQISTAVFAQSSDTEQFDTYEAIERDGLTLTKEWQGPTLRIRGRLYGSFESIEPPDVAEEDSRLNDAYLRKAEITLNGNLLRDLSYYFKTELMDAELNIRDAYISYDTGFVIIQAGYLDPINEVIIPSYREFMEGSATEGLSPNNQLGVALLREGDNWTFYAGAFKNTIDTHRVEKAGTMYSARFTIAPPVPDGYVLHIGAYTSWRKADDEEGLYRYSARSLLRTGKRYVDTGALADEDMLFGFELAANIGSISLESQCTVVRASMPSVPDAHSYLNGCYLTGLWNITGEIRNYGGDGFSLIKIDRPFFDGGPGAWQVGLRYDTIDLSDGAFQGGGQNNWTFSLNWYLNSQFWISGNYSHTKFKDNAFDGEVTDGLGARLHYMVQW